MVKKTFFKECLRAIRGSFSRFLAIFLIVALGAGFLAGLMATTPDMRHTVSELYHRTNLFDLRIAGNLGMEDADAEAIAAVPGVLAVMPARAVDRELLLTSGDTMVGRFHEVPQWEGDDPALINRMELKEGRWPQSPNECVVEEGDELYMGVLGLGQTLSLLPLDPDDEGEEPEDPFTVQQFTVVGTVASGYYVSMAQRGSTTMGSGTLGCIVYIGSDVLDMDYYTDIYAVVDGSLQSEAFTAEYDDLIAPVQAAVEDLAETQKHVRADRLRNDAQEELDEARQELADKTAEGDQELADALVELQDGEQEYADGLMELEDARVELADGYAELEDARVELADAYQELLDGEQELADALPELEDGEREYADGLAELQDAEQEIADAQQELADGKAELEEGRQELADALIAIEDGEKALEDGGKELRDAESQIAEGLAQISQYEAQLSQQESALSQQAAQLDGALQYGLISPEEHQAGMAQINAGLAQIGAAQKELTDKAESLAAIQQQLDQGRAEMKDAARQLRNARKQYNEGLVELQEAEQEIADAEIELADGIAELEDGRQELLDARAELDDGWKEYYDGLAEIEDGWKEYYDGLAEIADAEIELADAEIEIADGEQELIDARIELDDGWKEYEDGKIEFDEKIYDANQKIRDAQDQIDDIDDPEWYVLTRGESNESYIFYDSDTQKVAAIATVFPVFFFLVAALVASTTMTRMIDEDRGVIGTLKALGYSNVSIAGKYLLYATLACVLGAAVGLSLLLPLFPRVIAQAYALMYNLPPIEGANHTSFILLSAGLILIAVLLSTLGALKGALEDNAATLMRPKAPPAGKRILLERICPLWQRMKFTHKVTARNLFRYKKRFFMTVIGIAGCTALLVAGFGLRDSISDIVQMQFTQLQNYNMVLSLDHAGDDTADRHIAAILQDETRIIDYMTVHTEVGEGFVPGRDTDLQLVVTDDPARFTQFHTFRDRLSGDPVPFTGEGAILTEKAAKVLDLEVGDSLPLRNQDEVESAVPIAGICENYVQGYVFLSTDLYKETFGEPCELDTVFAKTTSADKAERDALAADLLESDNATGVSFSAATIETFADMLSSIDYIVILLIVAAAALAFVVLYNLTNINICERQKEIATLKVLGFYRREVSGYIFRETILLSIIGTAVGLFAGIFFHQFVVQTAEVDAVMFGRVIKPMSYVYSAAMSMLFTLLVSLFMQKKLHRIDMVESLKAPE